MAIKVIINAVQKIPPGTKETVGVSMTLISDYESVMPYNAGLNFTAEQAGSQKEAIHLALDGLIALADEIKVGATRAKDEHPIGGA